MNPNLYYFFVLRLGLLGSVYEPLTDAVVIVGGAGSGSGGAHGVGLGLGMGI